MTFAEDGRSCLKEKGRRRRCHHRRLQSWKRVTMLCWRFDLQRGHNTLTPGKGELLALLDVARVPILRIWKKGIRKTCMLEIKMKMEGRWWHWCQRYVPTMKVGAAKFLWSSIVKILIAQRRDQPLNAIRKERKENMKMS